MITTAPGPGNLTDADQERAERTFWHRALVGGLIGMALGALLWVAIVVIALAGAGTELGPWVGMGAAVGMFGGVFLGSWAGVMAGLGQLERAEHDLLAGQHRH
jgi:cobalamin synthase